jgi:phospholipid/cholesterol/gamma-HCH transport system substrate-binding protein
MNQNLKVGLMTLLTSAVLIYMVYVIGDFSFSERGYNFTISFYAINGLSKGSNVSMSGVKIGKVTSIEIVDDQVYVHAYISDKKHHIRRKSTFTISSAGLMGEKYVEIMPTRDYTSPYVADGEIIAGTDPVRMDELIEQGSVLLQRLQELTASAKDIIGDPDLKEDTRTMFRNARNASDNINEITVSLRNRSDHIIESLDKILNSVSEEIDKNRKDIKQIVENFKKISDNIEKITGGNKENLREIIANVKSSTDKLDDMIAKLNENDKMTNDIRATMDSLKDASENAKEITKEVKEIIVDKDIKKQVSTTLDDAHKLAKAVDKVFLNIQQTKVDFKYLLRYHKDTEDFLSDINVDIYPNNTYFFRIGMEDVGNENDINAMLARDANTKFIKRAGIMKSKVGIGVDYKVAKDLMLSVDLIDTKDSEVRLKASYLINEHITFELRLDDAADDEKINFGLEYVF